MIRQVSRAGAGFLSIALALAPGTPEAYPQAGGGASLENDVYRVSLQRDGSIEVTAKDAATRRFQPRFTILHRADDPGLKMVPAEEELLPVPEWSREGGGERTMDLFRAAGATVIVARAAELRDGTLRWSFLAHDRFELETQLVLPPGREEPQVSFRFTPRVEGFYSIGFTGAPATPVADVEAIWQPWVWQELRFPRMSFLSTEHMTPLPATLVASGGSTVGVAVDPVESPYRMPNFANSRWGVLLRNEGGEAQPMVFAPVLGHVESRMPAGQPYTFRVRLVVHPGDWFGAFRHLARNLYRFRDYRENATVSLNETLENLIELAMNDAYSGWVPELRGSDYVTDVPGSVKNVSSLHPLSIALVTDDENVYRRRALPMIEYMMSREKYLSSIHPDIRGQSASYYLRGPAAEVSELASLYNMSSGRSTVFAHYARDLFDKPRALNLDMISEPGSWQNALALYRMSGDAARLEQAKAGADEYLAERMDTLQKDFSDVRIPQGGQFWTDFAPKWIDLLELYEETGERRYLEAAARGAHIYATYTWFYPVIPDGDVLVHEGGTVGVHQVKHYHTDPQPMRAPEQRVPAWRVSQIGLTPEAANTYQHNPAVFLAHQAAYMLRVAHLTGDELLHDIARSAVVGRYANFPGYDINGEFATIYSRPDYPFRPLVEFTYNQVFYNHIWPQIALVTDYLVSDAHTKTGGRIDFPSRYAQGYAYLQSKVYGDRPGRFFDDDGVRLWLPRDLLRTDDIQANYVAGYGNGNFYIALINQSPETIQVRVTPNPDLVPIDAGRTYPVRVWEGDSPAHPAVFSNGEIELTVAPNGVTGIAIDGLQIQPSFQHRVFDAPAEPLSPRSHTETQTPFGKLTAMLISMGPTLTSGYVWLQATEAELAEARLQFRTTGDWQELVDSRYPYEFSVPLEVDEPRFELRVTGIRPDGTVLESEPLVLER